MEIEDLKSLNSNLILLILILRFSVAKTVSFKFQSDSINTPKTEEPIDEDERPLNSNLILLIPVFKDTFKTTGYNTYFRRPQK